MTAARDVIASEFGQWDDCGANPDDFADAILTALAEAGFEVSRWEQVGWLEKQAAYLPWKTFALGDASDNDHYEPVYRRVEGGATGEQT